MMPRQWVVLVSALLALASPLTSLQGQTTDALVVRLIACADSAHKLMNTNYDGKALTLLNTALHSPLRHKSILRTSYLLYELALLKHKQGHLDQSIQLLKQADTLVNQGHFLMFSYLMTAHTYQGLNDLQGAKQAVARATQWGKYHQSFDIKSILYLRMASIQAAQRHYHQAVLLGKEAVTLARSSQRPDRALAALDSLQRFQFLDGQYKAAWLTAQTVRQLGDSLASVTKTKTVADLDTRYKVAAREATIQELRNEAMIQKLRDQVRQRALEDANRQQARLLWITFTLSFGIVGIGFMLWRSQQLQWQTEQQRQLLESQAIELQELSQYKDKLFGMVSHDLRVPVIALKRIVTEGKQTYPTPSEWNTLRATLTTHIEQFYTLVNNVLYWSLGQIRLRVHLFFLDELMADSVETLSAEISQKRLRLLHHVAHEPLVADENITGLVVRNLLHNAIKFTPPGGTITLLSRRNDDELELIIRDTGPGLTATRHQRNSKLTSTGLGLVVSEELMTISGGRLRVDEVEPHGTEAVLSWPLSE